jgi:hypothetical protein
MLVVGSWLLGPSLAEAACLIGAGLTGLESGNQTLHVSIPNASGASQGYGISCAGSSGIVDPGATEFGTGLARFKTSSLGYRLYTSSIVGGMGSGSGSAIALGSVRYLVRVNSTPSYTGPTTVSLVVSMQFDVSGSISASGVASAGGSYDTEVSLKPADVQVGGVVLFIGGSALSPGGSSILQNSTPIDIDRNYVLQISHNQAVNTTFATGAMGEPGSAASSGTVAMSFTSELALLDAELSIEYPMVGLLGVPAPSLGNPPVFSVIVPIGGAVGTVLMVFLMTRVAMSKLRQDERDPLDNL